MNIITNIIKISLKFLWNRLRLGLILLIFLFTELFILSNYSEQNQYNRFSRAALELTDCSIVAAKELCQIKVSVKNNSSVTAKIPHAKLEAHGVQTYSLDPVFYDKFTNSDFDYSSPVIPPGQTVSYTYDLLSYSLNYDDLKKAYELTFSLEGSYETGMTEKILELE